MDWMKEMPISKQKRWVRVCWVVLGIMSLLTAVGFSFAALKNYAPISSAYAAVISCILWFAYGCLSAELVFLFTCLAIAIGVGVTGTAGNAAVPFGCAALIAYRIWKRIQLHGANDSAEIHPEEDHVS